MDSIKLAFASDHAGYSLKEFLKEYVENSSYAVDVIDLGTNSDESVHYPEYGIKAAKAIKDGLAEKAVIICGSGVGISIAANRIPGIRAALCHNGLMASLARAHNDANILALGSRMIGEEVAKDCLDNFLKTEFEGGRHAQRLQMLEDFG